MSQAWYFTRGAEQEGPVEWADLQRMAGCGQLAPNDRVWTDGFADWTVASGVPDLFAPSESPVAAVSAPVPVAATQTFGAIPMPPGASGAASFSAVPFIDYAAITAPHFAFAGFFMRFLAAFIDGLIVLAMGFGLAAAFMWWVGDDAARDNAPTVSIFIRVVFVVVGWMYFATLESGPRQSTLGKRMLGMRVTDMSGNQISFARASARHFGKILSQLVLFIGYLMMKFTPNSQCLHDMMAGCVVVKKEWN